MFDRTVTKFAYKMFKRGTGSGGSQKCVVFAGSNKNNVITCVRVHIMRRMLRPRRMNFVFATIIMWQVEITSGLLALRSVRPFVRLSKRPAKRTSARPTATDCDHSAEFARTERSASRDAPHSAGRSSNGSSNPGPRFRPNRDRCAAGAKRYEGVRGSDTRRNDRPANASRNPSESRARTGTCGDAKKSKEITRHPARASERDKIWCWKFPRDNSLDIYCTLIFYIILCVSLEYLDVCLNDQTVHLFFVPTKSNETKSLTKSPTEQNQTYEGTILWFTHYFIL